VFSDEQLVYGALAEETNMILIRRSGGGDRAYRDECCAII